MIKFINKLRRNKNYDKRRNNKVFKRKNGFTQKDIATKLGVEPATISKYKLDMRKPNIEALKKLSTIFNVSIDYLLGRTPDVFVDEANKESLDISLIKKKYDFSKKKIKNLKKEYKNENAIIIAVNEFCSGVGKTSYEESRSNAIISIEEIDNLFNDLENSKFPKPQIMMKNYQLMQQRELHYIQQNYQKNIMY